MNIPFKLLLLTFCQTVVALVFLKGFLLTRIELPDVSQGESPTCSSQLPPYGKAVVLIVDAVRYDFLCGKQGAEGDISGSLMPKTLSLVQAGAGSAVASRFVADTPTITMSRLKALLTGGLPTFLDIGQSFSASAITEDNLLQQLLAQNKRLVMMGDDTWMQLAQHAFTEAYPYPSFNVHDLHTVDDGVWEHLIPLLKRPHSWDLLIAHWLGVDHAGHTYGVNSRQMEDKLAQMDDQVSKVIEMLVAQAGAGGDYEDTLLVVLSDHGQTQGGDHGGGTPDETDSILITISLKYMNATLQQAQDGAAGADAGLGTTRDPDLLLHLLVASGYAGSAVAGQHASAGQAAAALSVLMVCRNTVPQIDLTPLLAHALGVPIPFGNLGKVPPHLFATLAAPQEPSAAAAAWLPEYSAALAANAVQVHTYLNRYAAVGGLPAAQLAAVNGLYAALQDKQATWRQQQQQQQAQGDMPAGAGCAGMDSMAVGSAGVAQLDALVGMQLQFLDAAADLARRRFTLFQQGPIWAGCVLGVVVLGMQLWYLRQLVSRPVASGSQAGPWDRYSALGFAGLAAFHALGLFSVGLIMGEGRLACVLLVAVTLILLHAALAAVLQARRVAQTATVAQQRAEAQLPDQLAKGGGSLQQQLRLVFPAAQAWDSWQPSSQAVRAAVSMLVCNVSLQLLGLIDRSGQDPHDKTQPTSELLVGPDASWQRLALLVFTAGSLLLVWVILCAASKLISGDAAARVAGALVHQQGGDKQTETPVCMTHGSCDVTRWLRTVCAIQFVCLGFFWCAQLFGHSDRTVRCVSKAAWSVLLQSPAAGLAGTLSGLAASILQHPVGVALSNSSLCSLPLRLLLPRAVYTPALAVLAGAVLLAVLPQACCAGKGHTSVRPRPLVLLWLCAVLAAPLVMVLGFKGPATMLLALLQAAGLCKLLRLRSAALSFICCTAQRSSTGQQGSLNLLQPIPDAVPGAASTAPEFDGFCSVVGAGAWGLMALQLLFCSGHFCEFSGLQYASAFIGFDDMVWYSSGSLLLINTCGFLFLGPLSLPVIMAGCTMLNNELASAAVKQPGLKSCSSSRSLSLAQQVECGLWVMNTMRFAALVASLVSAAVQQQHILLWAIFAPKLVFELSFMVVTAAGQLLVAGLLSYWL